MDARFELADVWTRDIEPDEYAAFLQRLLDDVATTSSDGAKYFWKEECDTVYGGYCVFAEVADDASFAVVDKIAAAIPAGQQPKINAMRVV